MPIDPSKLQAMKAALAAKPAAPAAPVAPAMPAAPAPKDYEVSRQDLKQFLLENQGQIFDQGRFASYFNLPAPIAQTVIDTLISENILDGSSHQLNPATLQAISYPDDARLVIKEPAVVGAAPVPIPVVPEKVFAPTQIIPTLSTVHAVVPPTIVNAPAAPTRYGFTNREIIDFAKANDGKVITKDILLQKYHISDLHAEEVIKDLQAANILDAAGIANAVKATEVEKNANANGELDHDYIFISPHLAPIQPPATSTPSPTQQPTPAVNPQPQPSAPATPAPAPQQQPVVPAGPPAAPQGPAAAPANGVLQRISGLTTSMRNWGAKVPKGYWAAALAGGALVAAGAIYIPKGGSEGVEKTKPAAEKTVDDKKPGAVPGAAGAQSKQEVAPGQLNPNYEQTTWWKQLDPKVQENIKTILAAPDVQSYMLPFLKNAKTMTGEPIVVSDISAKNIFDQMKGNSKILNHVYFGVNALGQQAAPWATLAKPAANEPSGPDITIDFTEAISKAAKPFHTIGEYEMSWQRSQQLEEGQDLAATFNINKAKVVKLVADNAK